MTDTVEVEIPLKTVSGSVAVKPKLQRDKKGRITKGVAQDTNKNGTAGRPCELCKNKEEILTKTKAYYDLCVKETEEGGKARLIQRATLARLIGHPQLTIKRWEEKSEEHPELCTALKKIDDLQEEQLTLRSMGRNPVGSIFLLKVNHGKVEVDKKLLGSDSKEPLEIVIVDAKERPTE